MPQIKRILLPTDFSECSAPATQYAFELAEQLDAELHLLHVIENLRSVIPDYYFGAIEWPRDYFTQIESATRQRLEQLVNTHGGRIRSISAVREGVPFSEIVQYAQEQDISLIVIGTHGRSGLAHAFMGSIAERVVRQAACPVLTVRPHS